MRARVGRGRRSSSSSPSSVLSRQIAGAIGSSRDGAVVGRAGLGVAVVSIGSVGSVARRWAGLLIVTGASLRGWDRACSMWSWSCWPVVAGEWARK